MLLIGIIVNGADINALKEAAMSGGDEEALLLAAAGLLPLLVADDGDWQLLAPLVVAGVEEELPEGVVLSFEEDDVGDGTSASVRELVVLSAAKSTKHTNLELKLRWMMDGAFWNTFSYKRSHTLHTHCTVIQFSDVERKY